MNVGEAEADAINRASVLVANVLQRPDQLQKVDQFKKRVQRKKLSVDAMLKTAMQSQLDGVRTGLNQLQSALVDLKDIKDGLKVIEESLVRVPSLSSSLSGCREEYLRHSQYAAAMENLKHIFTVPDSIMRTKKHISEGKLLNAHQCIMDLENSRDDLLYELHKLPHQNPNETRLLKEYFADVQSLSDELGKQLWIILHRTLNTVRKEPTQIVTALRIIEREERSDKFANDRHKSSGFLPPGRPRQWKQKAFQVLEKAVTERIEGNQFEDRETNKNWLIRHLEVIRMLLLDDFKVIQSLCTPCFPPHYDIVNAYVDMYHKNLSAHLVELVEGGLEEFELVTLLSWVLNTYSGPELLGHPALKLSTSRQGALLDNKVLEELKTKHIKNVKLNYESWMQKALELEEKEWNRPEPPQQDGENHYKTELPHLLHDMIRQNLDLATTISSDVQAQVFICSLEQVRLFACAYQKAITSYKEAYFEDRSKVQYFTTYMIALANSCQTMLDMMTAMKKDFWRPGISTHVDKKVATEFEALSNGYERLRNLVCDFLLEEALTDLQVQFNALLTTHWLTDSDPMDTICLTLNDYFQDYTYLQKKNFDYILEVALNTVSVKYITAIMQKRINLRSDEDRKKVADRIIKDADKLNSVFLSVSHNQSHDETCIDCIKGLAEVVKASDMEFAGLELYPLIKRYPDITQDHVSAILLLRGDVAKSDVRNKAAESILSAKKDALHHARPNSIFSHVHL